MLNLDEWSRHSRSCTMVGEWGSGTQDNLAPGIVSLLIFFITSRGDGSFVNYAFTKFITIPFGGTEFVL